MPTQNSRDYSESAPAGSRDSEPTRKLGPMYESTWQRLRDALQRVMNVNGVSEGEAQGAICQAIADGTIRIRGRLKKHATRSMTSKTILDGTLFEILALEPHHLDWEQSRPTKPWVVTRGGYHPAGYWHIEWIELSKSDVTKVLCAPWPVRRAEAASAQSAAITGDHREEPRLARRRGPQAKKLSRTRQAMMNDLRQGTLTTVGLRDTLEKNLSARYGVSRDTARKARNAVLSEFVEHISPTIDK